MTEREHCEAVARDVCNYLSAYEDGDEFRFFYDLFVRERAAARNEALEEAAHRVCLHGTGTCTEVWASGRNKCYCQDVRTLKKP